MKRRSNYQFGQLNSPNARAQKQRLVVIGGSSVLLAFTLLLGFFLVPDSDITAKPAPTPDAMVKEDYFGGVYLLTPVSEVEEGAKLSRVEFQKVYWPREKIPAGAVRDLEDISNLYAKSRLLPGQPVVRSSLSSSPPMFGLMAQIPPGYRATSILVDEEGSVDKWATAAAHVDVVLTYEDKKEGKIVTRIVVQDAIVLSFDRNTKPNKNLNRAPNAIRTGKKSTVTLLVSAEESLALQTAKVMGEIGLILRNDGDTSIAISTEHTSDNWDRDESRKSDSNVYENNQGTVRFSDQNGEEVTLSLPRNQNNWIEEDPDERFGE